VAASVQVLHPAGQTIIHKVVSHFPPSYYRDKHQYLYKIQVGICQNIDYRKDYSLFHRIYISLHRHKLYSDQNILKKLINIPPHKILDLYRSPLHYMLSRGKTQHRTPHTIDNCSCILYKLRSLYSLHNLLNRLKTLFQQKKYHYRSIDH